MTRLATAYVMMYHERVRKLFHLQEQPPKTETPKPAPTEPPATETSQPDPPKPTEPAKPVYTQADYDRIIREATEYAESYQAKGFTFEWKESMQFGWEVGYMGRCV